MTFCAAVGVEPATSPWAGLDTAASTLNPVSYAAQRQRIIA